MSESDNLATEEFLEWYVDTQNNDLMRRDYFLKVVVETKAKESDACLVLKKCSNDDNILSYKAIKQPIDIPQNVIQLLKSTDLDAYKLYPMVVIRKKLEIGGVHVALDQIYDEFGESYCVQSIKASTIEQVDSFLVNYNDFKPVYSKIFSILAAYDNFLDLPALFVPDFLTDYEVHESEFGHLIANENQFPDYQGCLKSEEELKEIAASRLACAQSLREWKDETGLKNECSF